MIPVAFDIETIPNEDLIDQLPEIEPPKNYKDPEKIEAYLKEEKAKQIQKMALSPFWGRICCSVFKDAEILSISNFMINEKDNVAWTLENLAITVREKGETLITWNGMSFDIPFLYTRAIILGVNFPSNLPVMSKLCRRYTVEPHCDLMEVYSGWDRSRRVSLDLAAKTILGKGKKDIDVSTFLKLLKEGKPEPILEHCKSDVELTLRLFDKAVNKLF